MEFAKILAELKKPFKPEQHKDRKLPGGRAIPSTFYDDVIAEFGNISPVNF